MITLAKPRNFMITNAEAYYPKLETPQIGKGTVNGRPFTTPLQFEIQLRAKDAATLQLWKDNHLPVKENKDGVSSLTIRRRALKADGSDNGKPRVVGSDKQPMDAKIIGNGSTVNVIVWQAPYGDNNESIFNSLTAVQVTELIEYSGSDIDFDVLGEMSPTVSGEKDEDLEAMF
tara:strand:- start:23165 stop:23686 length:522 start_codon:yes stop_codon:yes gene_type:complete